VNTNVSTTSSKSRESKSREYFFFILWAVIILVTGWKSEGWLQPDEHARVLEPAHFIAYGYASLPWELSAHQPIVSWFLGVLVSPILMVTKYLNIEGLGEAGVVRSCVGLLASTRFIAIWKIMEMLGLNTTRRSFYLLVMMAAVFGPLFIVRTSQENFATTALVWAYFYALKIRQQSLTKPSGIKFGFLLALVFSARPQVGLAAAGLGLWMLKKEGKALIIPSALGLFLGLLPMAVVDIFKTGVPFLPVYNYLNYALGNEGGGALWGTSPWWYYIPQYLESWYPPISVCLIIPIFVGLWNSPSLASLVTPFVLIHFILGHKETRYFSPMIPFMQLSMFLGIEWLEQRHAFTAKITASKKFWIRTLQTVAALTLIAGLLPFNTSPWMYNELGKRLRNGDFKEFTYIGNTASSFSQFYAKFPNPPKFNQISWNDVRDGKEAPSGWLAFYALDPEDFRAIEQSCHAKGLTELPDWMIDFITLFPRSPARRRINTVVFCPQKLVFVAKNHS